MKINFNKVTSLITEPKKIGPAVFIATGVYKTCKDYKKAKPERKKRAIVKDLGILGGSAVGFSALALVTSRLCKPNFTKFLRKIYKKLPEKSLQKTEKVLKDCIQGTLNTFGGILGAIYTNELMQKYVLNKPYFVGKNAAPSKAKKTAAPPEESTANRVFSTLVDLPSFRFFEKPMVALTGFSVANTRGYHNKFKMTSNELLANTLIPTFFVSVTSLFVNDKKPIVKYPALFGSLVVGAYAGGKIADKYQDAIDDAIDDIDLRHIVVS